MNYDVRFYRTLLLRRLPVMLLIIGIGTVIGLGLALKLPPIYDSEAQLLVEGPQISDDLAPSTVRVATGEQLQILRQRLLVRENLIEIANDLKVFPNRGDMTSNEVVDRMRSMTNIGQSGGRDSATLVRVGFSSREPRIAAAVVNEYVTRLLEESARFRTGQAGNTLDFFENEVERLSGELSRKSAQILEYKSENIDALPDGQNYRLNRQETLQERVTRLERELEGIRTQKERVAQIYQETGRLTAGEGSLTPLQRQLNDLENELSRSLAVYSPTNPKIRVLQTRISQLQQEVAREQGVEGDDDTQIYDVAMAEFDGRAQTIEEELSGLEEELASLDEAIRQTPQVGIQLSALERDYNNIRSQYDTAVSRLATAETGERIEVTSQGQRISLVEEATVPDSPSSPNRPLIAAMGLGGGVGVAVALFVLLELLNTTVRRPSELVSRLGVTPIAAIPYIETRLSRRMRLMRQFGMAAAVVVALPLALWAVNTWYMPLDVVLDRVLLKLGLI